MTIDTKRWIQLHQHIREERDGAGSWHQEVLTLLLQRLKNLATQGHCSKNVVGWFSTETAPGGRRTIALKRGTGVVDNRGRPAIPLKGLAHLQDNARLTVSIVLDGKGKRLLDYSIGIQGKTKKPDQPWYARIDLTENPEGVGLCGHPLLHCHVGVSPDEDSEAVEPEPAGSKIRAFTSRAPLPWLMPHDALDWLLATVDPKLEPT